MCHAAQLLLILCDPLDYSPSGSSVDGIFQARILEWVCRFPPPLAHLTQGLNTHLLHLLHCRQILYPLSHLGSPPFSVPLSYITVLIRDLHRFQTDRKSNENYLFWGSGYCGRDYFHHLKKFFLIVFFLKNNP